MAGCGVGAGPVSWCQGWDDGADIVDVGFARAGDEEEARGQEPHCSVGEEGGGGMVEQPGFLAAEESFLLLFLDEHGF